jgi:hypothetical protein
MNRACLMYGIVQFSFLALSALPASAATTSGSDMKAVSLGGVNVMCGTKKSGAEDERSIADYAKAHDLKSVDMSKDDEKKLINAINAAEPVTTMKVDKIIVYKNDDNAFLFVVNGGRFCAMHPLPTKIFNQLADQAFGAGS